MIAAAAGVLGYALFPTQFEADGKDKGKRALAFVAICLIGISQIGAIVCSLASLSSGLLSGNDEKKDFSRGDREEQEPLLTSSSVNHTGSLAHLKGAAAGIYSFYGGAAILILTKLGGILFDRVSTGAPFYIMAAFNGILLLASGILGLRRTES